MTKTFFDFLKPQNFISVNFAFKPYFLIWTSKSCKNNQATKLYFVLETLLLCKMEVTVSWRNIFISLDQHRSNCIEWMESWGTSDVTFYRPVFQTLQKIPEYSWLLMNRVMGESNTKLFLGFNVPGLILRSPSKQLGRFFRSKLKT